MILQSFVVVVLLLLLSNSSSLPRCLLWSSFPKMPSRECSEGDLSRMWKKIAQLHTFPLYFAHSKFLSVSGNAITF